MPPWKLHGVEERDSYYSNYAHHGIHEEMLKVHVILHVCDCMCDCAFKCTCTSTCIFQVLQFKGKIAYIIIPSFITNTIVYLYLHVGIVYLDHKFI